ncbi:MAG: PrsW family glutamic-type intramembrane protease [Kiritimatiellia bacterium]
MEPLPASGLKGSVLYKEWYRKQKACHRPAAAWTRTVLFALLAGPLAVASAFLIEHPGSGILMLVVAGPLIEELGKVLLPLMTVEKNPARFTRKSQLLLCAVAGGLVFSIIENLIYLHVYLPDPGPGLIWWRWTVCVALHVGCSFLAGWGVAKCWQEADEREEPARLETAAPLLLVAVGIHGVYNLMATFLDPLFQ